MFMLLLLLSSSLNLTSLMLSLMSILFFCHWNSSSRTAAKQHEKLVTPWFGLVFLGLVRFCLLVDINNNDNYNKDHIKERPGAEHVYLQLWLLLLLLLLSSYKKWKNTKNVYKIKLNSLLLYFKFKIFISMSSTWLAGWLLGCYGLHGCCYVVLPFVSPVYCQTQQRPQNHL